MRLERETPSILSKYANDELKCIKKCVRKVVENAIADSFKEPLLSKILSAEQERQLVSFVQPSSKKSVRLELLYRASLDGWGREHLHSRCHNKGPTITIVQIKRGSLRSLIVGC
jgi:hypothetical protein